MEKDCCGVVGAVCSVMAVRDGTAATTTARDVAGEDFNDENSEDGFAVGGGGSLVICVSLDIRR